jgi:hypothetical protein
MLAIMTADPEKPQQASGAEDPYHVRTTINQEAKKELFRLRSRWEELTGERVALPLVSGALLELALSKPELLREVLDTIRGTQAAA